MACVVALNILTIYVQNLPSGFGAFHAALLGLGGKFFLREKWEDLVVPTNDAEQAETQRPSPGVNRAENFFEHNVDQAVGDLHKSLLAYYVATTDTSGESFFLLYTPQFLFFFY